MSPIQIGNAQNIVNTNLTPDAQGQIGSMAGRGFIAGQGYAYFWDLAMGGGITPRRFVLLSPNLTKATLAKFLPVLRDHLVPSGFRAEDARGYRNVYFVGAVDGLDDLAEAGALLAEVTGATTEKKVQRLKALLTAPA